MQKSNTHQFLLILFAAGFLFLAQTAYAQSGRRISTPTHTPQQPTAADVKTKRAEPESKESEPVERISQLILAGEMQESSWSWKSSNYLKNVLDNYLDEIKRHRSLDIKTSNAGK